MWETADGLVCSSPFVCNPSSDSMLGTAGGNCGTPFIWNQSAAPILWDLLVQSSPLSQVPWWELLVVHAEPSLGHSAVTANPQPMIVSPRSMWELLVAVCPSALLWNS